MINKQEHIMQQIYLTLFTLYTEEILAYPWHHYLYRQHIRRERE